MHHRNWLASLVLGFGLTVALVPVASGQGCYGGGYSGYDGLRSVNSLRHTGSRLYRHRSGYLYGHYRSYSYPSQHGGYPAYGGPVVVAPLAPTADQSCGVYLDPRQDFDCRRDRLLKAASNIDVSFLYAQTSEAQATPADGPGWTFIEEGEPAKALGRFTARLMRSPGDSTSQIGYALAAALLGDDASAAAAMGDVMRVHPRAISEFTNAERFDGITRALLDRYAAVLDQDPAATDARVMTIALHAIRDEVDAARGALAAAPREAAPREAVAQRD